MSGHQVTWPVLPDVQDIMDILGHAKIHTRISYESGIVLAIPAVRNCPPNPDYCGPALYYAAVQTTTQYSGLHLHSNIADFHGNCILQMGKVLA